MKEHKQVLVHKMAPKDMLMLGMAMSVGLGLGNIALQLILMMLVKLIGE